LIPDLIEEYGGKGKKKDEPSKSQATLGSTTCLPKLKNIDCS
jgi:hypothetical protein